MSDEEIAAVRDGHWQDHGGLQEFEKRALRYAEQATSTPPAVERSLVEELARESSNEMVTALAAAIAWENFRARFNCALGVEGHKFYEAMQQNN